MKRLLLIIVLLLITGVINVSGQKLIKLRVNTLFTTYTTGIYNGTLELGLELPCKGISVVIGPSFRYGKTIYTYSELGYLSNFDFGGIIHFGILEKLYLGGGLGVTSVNYSIDNIPNTQGLFKENITVGNFTKLRLTGTIQYVIVKQGGITLNIDYLIGNISDIGGINHANYITNLTVNLGFTFIINHYHK